MDSRKKKILIVEDEELFLKLLVDKITAAGYSVITAKNGKLGLAEAILSHPDLIVLDLFMPVEDGIEMLAELRRSGGEWGKQVPVIVLTNLGTQQVEAQLNSYNIAEFLIKANTRLDDVIKKIDARFKSPQ